MSKTFIVKNLTKTFENEIILNNISFQINEHDFLVIIGQSGIGKSVLLKILIGLLPYDNGLIKIDGYQPSILFQSNPLFEHMTISENIEFPILAQKFYQNYQSLCLWQYLNEPQSYQHQ